MPRLRNAAGVVVDVSKETAKLLDGFEPADKPTPGRPAATEKPPAKSAAKSR